MIPLIFLCCSLFQQEVPYKAPEEFSVKFMLTFNKRNEYKSENQNIILDPIAAKENLGNEPLPFIQVSLDILKKQELETRVKIVRDYTGNQILKKKIKEGMSMIVFSEFVDDIKDQISGYNHTIYFLNEDGEAISKIVIEFDKEGFYLVNGKRRGVL